LQLALQQLATSDVGSIGGRLEHLRQLATALGVAVDEVAGELAHHLPAMINKASPNGLEGLRLPGPLRLSLAIYSLRPSRRHSAASLALNVCDDGFAIREKPGAGSILAHHRIDYRILDNAFDAGRRR
jgi:hypothetical protein